MVICFPEEKNKDWIHMMLSPWCMKASETCLIHSFFSLLESKQPSRKALLYSMVMEIRKCAPRSSSARRTGKKWNRRLFYLGSSSRLNSYLFFKFQEWQDSLGPLFHVLHLNLLRYSRFIIAGESSPFFTVNVGFYNRQLPITEDCRHCRQKSKCWSQPWS